MLQTSIPAALELANIPYTGAGMRVDQLATAVCQLVPAAQFWYKHHASLDDLIALITEHLYPVGVEWQGFFKVNNVTLAGNTYNSSANHDPDGDSNGTTIIVSQP